LIGKPDIFLKNRRHFLNSAPESGSIHPSILKFGWENFLNSSKKIIIYEKKNFRPLSLLRVRTSFEIFKEYFGIFS